MKDRQHRGHLPQKGEIATLSLGEVDHEEVRSREGRRRWELARRYPGSMATGGFPKDAAFEPLRRKQVQYAVTVLQSENIDRLKEARSEGLSEGGDPSSSLHPMDEDDHSRRLHCCHFAFTARVQSKSPAETHYS